MPFWLKKIWTDAKETTLLSLEGADAKETTLAYKKGISNKKNIDFGEKFDRKFEKSKFENLKFSHFRNITIVDFIDIG